MTGSWGLKWTTHTNKLDKLEVAEKSLQKYNLSRLKQEEIGNLNRPITRKKAKEVKKQTRTEKQRQKQNTSKEKPRFFWWILANVYRRINTNPSQTLFQ